MVADRQLGVTPRSLGPRELANDYHPSDHPARGKDIPTLRLAISRANPHVKVGMQRGLTRIGSNARVQHSPLTFDVQIRSFLKDSRGTYSQTTIEEYELSRKPLLANPSSGGLVRVDPDDPAYLPTAGNDYTFASPTLGEQTPQSPILGSLRRRCEACHGEDAGSFFTFARVPLPKPWRPPAVRQFKSIDDPHAGYVAQCKMKQADFKGLCWLR